MAGPGNEPNLDERGARVAPRVVFLPGQGKGARRTPEAAMSDGVATDQPWDPPALRSPIRLAPEWLLSILSLSGRNRSCSRVTGSGGTGARGGPVRLGEMAEIRLV